MNRKPPGRDRSADRATRNPTTSATGTPTGTTTFHVFGHSVPHPGHRAKDVSKCRRRRSTCLPPVMNDPREASYFVQVTLAIGLQPSQLSSQPHAFFENAQKRPPG